MERVILLVDDEENIIRSLKRLLRRDGYTVLTANSGKEGLELLKDNQVGVIVSDQRMPEMSGTEFLSKIKDIYPDTVRIVLSGYTDLKSITDAINNGAIYRFLTKPWDDELLRKNIQEAFHRHELREENVRLQNEVSLANKKLVEANKVLDQDVMVQTRLAEVNTKSLILAQQMLENLPVGIIGYDANGLIAMANSEAHHMLLPGKGCMVGSTIEQMLPDSVLSKINGSVQQAAPFSIELPEQHLANVIIKQMDAGTGLSGNILVLIPEF